jgi:hypothetical protein
MLKAEAMEAFENASDQNVENTAIYISPTFSGYYRT